MSPTGSGSPGSFHAGDKVAERVGEALRERRDIGTVQFLWTEKTTSCPAASSGASMPAVALIGGRGAEFGGASCNHLQRSQDAEQHKTPRLSANRDGFWYGHYHAALTWLSHVFANLQRWADLVNVLRQEHPRGQRARNGLQGSGPPQDHGRAHMEGGGTSPSVVLLTDGSYDAAFEIADSCAWTDYKLN